MMDVTKLNNQIILMRKSIKVAKVYIIRKLLKQIKLWSKKKGRKKEITEKIERKVQRLKTEVEIIRKLKMDEVSIAALQEDKQWSAIVNEKNVTEEERSLARLISYKLVQEKVLQFRNSNPDLQSLLPLIIQKWQMKKSFRIEMMKNTQNTNVTPIQKEETNDEINTETQDDGRETADSKVVKGIKKSSKNTCERKEKKTKQTKLKKRTKKKKQIGSLEMEPKITEMVTQEDEDDGDSYDNVLTECLFRKKDIIPNKIEGTMEISQIDLDKLEDENIPVHEPVQRSEVPLSQKKSKDPLFLFGGENEDDDYSDEDNDFKSDNSDGEDSKDFRFKSQFIDSLSSSYGKLNKRNSWERQQNKKRKPKSFPKMDFKKGIKSTEKMQEENKEKCIKSTPMKYKDMTTVQKRLLSLAKDKPESDSNLHPSWEAKRRQHSTILPFQGKKIKFE